MTRILGGADRRVNAGGPAVPVEEEIPEKRPFSGALAVLVIGLGASGAVRVIPTLRLTLDCPCLDDKGGPNRVRAALKGVRGVRGGGFVGHTQAIVYYDGRHVTPQEILRALQRTGCPCRA